MSGFEQGWALEVILWFQSWRTPLIAALGQGFAFLGTENFLMPFMVFVYWCIDAAFGRRLTILFLIDTWLNVALKETFQRPRPGHVSDQVRPVIEETSPGLPSTHAETATVIGVMFARKIKRNWVTVLLVLYALLMAVSRMVVGVHFPQDVAAGLILGLVMAGLYIWLEPRASAWLNRQTMWTQIGLGVAAGVGLLIVHPLLIPSLNADDYAYTLSLGGTMIGAGAGFALETRLVGFSAEGVLWKRLARLALGMAILMAVRFGLGAIFELLEPMWLFRIIRYTCIGLSVSWLAPWLFVTLKLADRKPG